MDAVTVGSAATRTGWSPRMLRYLEQQGLVVPCRSASGYRVYGLGELNQLTALRDLRRKFDLELGELAFAARLRRESALRAAVASWLAAADDTASWMDWEQRKHERLLAV